MTLTGHLRSARASLALSAWARPCSFVCVGIQLPRAQAVPAHTHEVKSCLTVDILWPCWPEGAYQNVVIYGCEFVVQCMGSEHLCRKALNSSWQGCSLYHCQLTVFKLTK